MMRRKNTSRRVHALSSDSIRSDEIAATDIALSRGLSRDGVSDMRRIGALIWGNSASPRRFLAPLATAVLTRRDGKINCRICAGQDAVTAAMQDARIRTNRNSLPPSGVTNHGDQIRASDRTARRAAAANRPFRRTRSISRFARAATARRNGRGGWCGKTSLTADDLIWPLFVVDGHNERGARRLDARRRPAQRRSGGA